MAVVLALFALFSTLPARADIPDAPRQTLEGMYKVQSCNDPFFPMDGVREWFMDFGNGMRNGQTSGKVAVSLRESLNVRVRIMVWQYFASENVIMIGNQYEEGSGGAVARGAWNLGGDSGEIWLNGQNGGMVIKKADPADY